MGGLKRQGTNKTGADSLVRKRKQKERDLQEEQEDKTQNLNKSPKQKIEKNLP